jgi:hypothetical protein
MKISSYYLVLIVIVVCYVSCKKDIDRKLVGTYKGTARYLLVNHGNPIPSKDTLYTDVLITVSEGTESTRKEIRLKLEFAPSTIQTSYEDNIYINNGVVDYTRTNSGSAGTYYKWKGNIASDSLNLTNRVEGGNGDIVEWNFKARKQ